MRSSILCSLNKLNQETLESRAPAVGWRRRVSTSISMGWLPNSAGAACFADVDSSRFLTDRQRVRIRRVMQTGNAAWRARAVGAVLDRAAMRLMFAELFDFGAVPDMYLFHTALGGPKVAWRGQTARWARESGLSARDLHISFTHDGDSHIGIMAHAPGLRGLGVDVVHLPRLRKPERNREWFRRFGAAFMSEDELAWFESESEKEDLESMMIRAAAHFSLMESASKALGTGLRIGGGMGKPTSLPKQSLNLESLNPVEFALGPEVESRCGRLSATRLEGHWGADEEYLVSAALLW